MTVGILSANLLGRQHALQHAKRRKVKVAPLDADRKSGPKPEQFADTGKLSRFAPTEAINFFRNSLKLPMKTVEKLVANAGTRSRAAAQELTNQIRELIDQELTDALRNGSTLDEFVGNVQQILERGGLSPANPFRLETIFRTNLKTAATAGRLEQLEHPEVKEVFQWLQYNAVIDGATRPEHAAMNGKVYRADDPIWKTWMPPNGFNCRCSVTPVSREDIEDEGLSVSRVAPKVGGNRAQPDKGFRVNNATALKRNPKTGL